MKALQSLKKRTFSEAVANAISVCDSGHKEIALLVPIGGWALEDDHLLKSFSAWRKVFMRFFLTQFDVSAVSTRGYLQRFSITQSNRILFAIYVDRNLIGHIGLCDVDKDQAELDNLIRGKSGGHSDLMYHAERAVLTWAFDVLGVKKVSAKVMSKNFLAISLHERLGFQLIEKRPLRKVVHENHFSFEPCGNGVATEIFCLDIMEVSSVQCRKAQLP